MINIKNIAILVMFGTLLMSCNCKKKTVKEAASQETLFEVIGYGGPLHPMTSTWRSSSCAMFAACIVALYEVHLMHELVSLMMQVQFMQR